MQREMGNMTQIFNASSFIQPPETDFFDELYSDTLLKQFTIALFFLGSIFGLISEFGVIWYERNGDYNYRTVVNQLFSTVSWIVVFWILLVYIPLGIRYLVGPLNATYCTIHIFLRTFFISCIVLMVDCIIFLRCIFIFKFSSFAVADDNFIATFLQMTIIWLSVWVATAQYMSFDQMPLWYFMCSGNNPVEGNGVPSAGTTTANTFNYIILGLTIILHIAVFFCIAKIFLYQRTTEQKSKRIELGRMDITQRDGERRTVTWEDARNKQASNLPKSMADLTTQILCLIFALLVSIVQMVMAGKTPDELNEYQNRWLVYFTQIIAGAVAILGISAQYYAKNKALPRAIWRSLRQMN